MKNGFTLAEGATHVVRSNKKLLFGFTLAEVLITLGIIGVVASLTMPSVIVNYQKQRTVAQLKKVYTVLNQAIKLSEAENGGYEYWLKPPDIDAIEYFDKYLRPYMKILKTCDNYRACGYSTSSPWYYKDGAKVQVTVAFKENMATVMLSDGVVVLFMVFIPDNSDIEATYVIVDLNGPKGPNTYGKDLFRFKRINGKGIMPDDYHLDTPRCSESGSNGVDCASKIMKDGWQISDDYPW